MTIVWLFSDTCLVSLVVLGQRVYVRRSWRIVIPLPEKLLLNLE